MRRISSAGAIALLGTLTLASGCTSGGAMKTGAAPAPAGERDLIALLPDPGTGNVGRAIVSNAAGSVDLEGARASTTVAPNQKPSPVARLSEADVRKAFEGVLDALPQAPEHFTLNFLFDSDVLTPASMGSVPDILRAVQGRPFPDVLVLGHTDTVGRAAANVALGLKRATLVRSILVNNGLNAAVIEVDSHGEADPLVKTADEIAEPRNRRVEITVR